MRGGGGEGGSFSFPYQFVVAEPPVAGPLPSPDAPSYSKPEDPDSIDRENVSYVVTTLRPKIRRCGDRAKIGGRLKVRVTVKRDGRVASATHENAADLKLGQCIAALFKTARFKKSKNGGVFTYPFNFDPPLPSGELDRATISAGVAKAKTAIMACGDRIKAGGTVKVKVVVAAAGHVMSAAQDGELTELGTCVVDVMKTVTFGSTASGGTFSYPFVFAAPVIPTTTDVALDRGAIAEGIGRVKVQLSACAKSGTPRGTVKVKVTVSPAGTVTSITVDATPDPALGACVATVVQRAMFKPTQQGGNFSYPFVF